MERKIEIKTDFDRLKIYFDGLLHLVVRSEELSIQSWFEDCGMYYIEYYQKNGVVIMTHYNNRIHWEELLRQLDKII